MGYTEGTFYVVVVLGTFVFFAYCGIKLYMELKKNNKTISDPESRMKKLRRVRIGTFLLFFEELIKIDVDDEFYLDE